MAENDTLNKLYQDLFNSLGVEPGLLSKTKIGRDLNEKYKDDSIDALTYSERYVKIIEDENNDDNKATISHYSPIANDEIGSLSDKNMDISVIQEEPSLWKFIREYQLQKHMTNDDVIHEILEYLNRYINGYTIIHYHENVIHKQDDIKIFPKPAQLEYL